jgi:hypothetical protein
MKWNPITRRHFLEGAGSTLLLPFLPSLWPEKAAAQALLQKNLICIPSFHGMFRQHGPTSILMPQTTTLNGSLAGYNSFTPTGRHKIHYRSLTDVVAQNGKVSELIDAQFNPYVSKMLMMQGFDILALGWYHHDGHFGNYPTGPAWNSGAQSMASIDQVAANSLGFYKNANLRRTSVAYAESWAGQQNIGTSFAYKDPNNPVEGGVDHKPGFYSPQALWDAFFGSTTVKSPIKSTLVDRVLADYKSTRLNPRLGAEDRIKMDNHIALLAETQKKVNAVSQVCSQLRPTTTVTDAKLIIEAINSVIVSLISCGLCHVFHGWSIFMNTRDINEWHSVWAHGGYANDTDTIGNQFNYDKHVEATSLILKYFCLDLVKKLDQIGQLDNSLVVWVQEHSKRGHESWNIPIITFGSAGGVFKTGQHVDFRNLALRDDKVYTTFGYPHSQALANFLRAVDVPVTEYEALNKIEYSDPLFKPRSGYSTSKIHADFGIAKQNYGTWTGHDLSSWLPLIKT